MELKNIAASLAKFHELMGDIPKNADNSFFKSKYAPLETILPAIKKPLAEAGLVFTQIPTGLNKLKTVLFHVASGETVEGGDEKKPSQANPQQQASAITYMRRYALVAMLGLNTDEDDDGSHTSDTAKVMTRTVGAKAATIPIIRPPLIKPPVINPNVNVR